MKTKVFILDNGADNEKTYLPVCSWNRLWKDEHGTQVTRLDVIGLGNVLLYEDGEHPARFTDIHREEIDVLPYESYAEAKDVCEAFEFYAHKKIVVEA